VNLLSAVGVISGKFLKVVKQKSFRRKDGIMVSKIVQAAASLSPEERVALAGKLLAAVSLILRTYSVSGRKLLSSRRRQSAPPPPAGPEWN
jgi:hypothetical protein